MKARIISLVLLIGVCLGCSGDKAPIAEKDMEDFLVEYYTLYACLRHAQRESRRLDRNAVFADFIKQKGYTPAQVDSAFAYYGARPRYYREIYERVVKRLEKNKEEIDDQLNQ